MLYQSTPEHKHTSHPSLDHTLEFRNVMRTEAIALIEFSSLFEWDEVKLNSKHASKKTLAYIIPCLSFQILATAIENIIMLVAKSLQTGWKGGLGYLFTSACS